MAEQHPHDLVKVLPIDFLVFVYIENPEVKLYFLVYASSRVEERHDFCKLCEVDISFSAHKLDERGVVISVELVASVIEALIFLFFIFFGIVFLILIPTLLVISFVNVVFVALRDWVYIVLLPEQFPQVFQLDVFVLHIPHVFDLSVTFQLERVN